MKLVLAVVSNQAAEGITDALLAAGFRATRMASTGGFRREGNTTIMMGIDDEDVEPVLAILKAGVQAVMTKKSSGSGDQPAGRGVALVLPLEDYIRL